MTQGQQPEALRLALSIDLMDTFTNYQQEELDKAAAELRRQHARIAELEAQLDAIGAGGVETLRRRECLHQIAEPAPATTEKPVAGCSECYITHDLGACDTAAPAAQGDAEDAARYRWLKSQASEELLNPRAARSEICPDMRTHWKLPTLICSGPVGGYLDFDASIDAMNAGGAA